MSLLRNTLVFIDTGFFKDIKPKNAAYNDFFEYALNDKIILCTSPICLEEWRTQKVKHLCGFIKSTSDNFSNQKNVNPLSFEILDDAIKAYLPDRDFIFSKSKEFVDKFVDANKIKVYSPRKEHIQLTWGSYFHGNDPFKEEKNKDDIPDAWIFESAKDALNDLRHIENKFCIGSDKTLCKALTKLGFESISLTDLLAKLCSQETTPSFDLQTSSPDNTVGTVAPPATAIGSELDRILATAINESIKNIYLRILGYSYWLSGPSKQNIINAITPGGYDEAVINACIILLTQHPLRLIKDTGNHILPANNNICKEAADRIMPEILELLDQG